MYFKGKPNVVIHLGDFTWHMVIDVTALAMAAGHRYQSIYTGKIYTDYPISRAKKLLKLIYCYADAEDLNKVTEVLAELNHKLDKYWRELIHEED